MGVDLEVMLVPACDLLSPPPGVVLALPSDLGWGILGAVALVCTYLWAVLLLGEPHRRVKMSSRTARRLAAIATMLVLVAAGLLAFVAFPTMFAESEWHASQVASLPSACAQRIDQADSPVWSAVPFLVAFIAGGVGFFLFEATRYQRGLSSNLARFEDAYLK
jgi:heme/copper-type cytochrome/quinol oxidase subunit 1